jgi:transcription elongation factor Elf1
VDNEAPHADSQDRRLKRLAREKGFTCPECGASEPVPKEGGELKGLPDGALEVPVRCEACEGASEMALVLSPEEAQALGFHSLEGDED